VVPSAISRGSARGERPVEGLWTTGEQGRRTHESRRAILGTAVSLLLVTIACAPTHVVSLDEEARRYVRLAVALGERDFDSLDFYAGPADLVADVRRDPPKLAAIRSDAAALAARLSGHRAVEPAERQRVAVIVRNLGAIVARVDLLTGTRLSFDRESLEFFGVAPGSIDEDRILAIRSQIAAVIGGRGRLVDRYSAFAARFVVPGDRLRPVIEAALAACREATVAHLTLPQGEHVTLEFVRDKPWSAFSRYLGNGRSVIQVNADFQFTVDQALQIACHEGYPGHHARNLVRTTGDAVSRWPERSVQLTFSPESFASEASATVAADVAFPPDQRLAVVRDRLFPVAGIPPAGAAPHVAVERLVGELQIVQADVARRYLDGALEFARAAAEMEERALVPHAEALIKYINRYRTYVTTYTTGAEMFRTRCLGPDTSAQSRWRCFLQDITSR
jgi:hypothetical protein